MQFAKQTLRRASSRRGMTRNQEVGMPATAQSNTAERGKEVFRLNLLEKVEKHVNIIVLAAEFS